MNLLLFGETEDASRLRAGDPRLDHLVSVLGARPGSTVDVGRVGGPFGRATVVAIDASGATLATSWVAEPDPGLAPPGGASLLLGCPRPIEGRRILEDAVGLGFSRIVLCRTGRADPNYLRAGQYGPGETREALSRGAAQAFTTRLPEVLPAGSIAEGIALAGIPGARTLALDVYEAATPLEPAEGGPLVLAVGPERGWDDRDRAALREAGFAFRHLGPAVLRTPVAIAVAAGRLGLAGPTTHLVRLAALRALR